jgi:type III secretion protein U
VNEDTERKSLPASEKKLRDARSRRGQVAHSRDLVAGISLLVMLAYLLFAWPGIRDQVVELIDTVAAAAAQPFAQTQQRTVGVALETLAMTSGMIAAVVLVSTLAAGMVATGGPLLSFEHVKPKLEHISPLQGAKRIFSMRNLVEWAKGIAKIVSLMVAFWFVLRGWLQPLFEIPACGQECVAPMVVATLRPLAATAALAFIAIGLVDVLVQRELFLHDMRMTRTELKREQKDLEGDPLILGERRRIRHTLVGGVRTGLRQAIVVVAHGDTIVGLRYRPGETPIPIVVCKGMEDKGRRMMTEARDLGIPIFDDAVLATALAEHHAVGEVLQREFFKRVAEILLSKAPETLS